MGLSNDKGRAVYLSDGGHFDNLGLYEMVRRRCRFIIVSDVGCDPRFAFEDIFIGADRLIRLADNTIKFRQLQQQTRVLRKISQAILQRLFRNVRPRV